MRNTPERARFQGVLQIVRFNWPMYATAAAVLIVGTVGLLAIPLPALIRALGLLAIAFASFGLVISLAVSHYVYDLSSLYRAEWLRPMLPQPPQRYADFHVGLDEFSEILRAEFPESEASVIDFFDPEQMTEPSILRARREQAAKLRTAVAANFRALPFRDQELDAAFVMFAAHELRRPLLRVELFRELQRILKTDGRIILVEHLRDLPNFLAFGPGFLHFHSRAEWMRAISESGLTIAKEFSLTPFVRAFALQRDE